MPSSRIRVPLSTALRMIADYAGVRLRAQLKAVAFIVIYLVAFQMLVFGSAPAQALRISGGIALVVLGLALFLEGLILGLMPLAKGVGVQMSSRGGLKMILLIGLLVGVGATLAEPAIGALRVVGGNIAAWEAPLLFYLLQRQPELLIAAIAAGVGLAVALGMLRFYVGFSLKPLILTIIPVLLAITLFSSYSANMSGILALAWDAGAITTGPVTVPLVLALGIGVARSSGKSEGAGSGFGIVTLASALPVLTVLLLGLVLLPRLPAPCSEDEFFAPANREQAMRLFAGEDELRAHALSHGGERTRKMFQLEAEGGGCAAPATARTGDSDTPSFAFVFSTEARNAARAVLPLAALLGIVLFWVMRSRPRYLDEALLGVVFTLVGMTLLATGIRTGLSVLGNDAGRRLPEIYRDVEVERGQVVIRNFDPEIVFYAMTPEGGKTGVFHYYDGKKVQTARFNPDWYDAERRIYTHRIRASGLVHPELSRIGLMLVLVFAFGMGYGSTVAEPALMALGRTVEDLSVGTIKGVSVVRVVSVGVGIGLVLGVIRILYAIPIAWVILPPYLLLLPLTLMSDEDFAGIAWDSGGVTTGPVTVPLVLAMGVGLGKQIDIVDGFGILAMASAYPILTVLLFGLAVRLRQHHAARAAEGANANA